MRPTTVTLLLTLAAALPCHAETFAPAISGISRYEQIWKRSPFIQETPPIPPLPLSAKFALVGIVSLQGRPVAFLIDRRETDPARSRFMIFLEQRDTAHDLQLLSVSLDPVIQKSTVKIQRGAEQATLAWDPAVLDPHRPKQPAQHPPGSELGGKSSRLKICQYLPY